MKEMSNSERVEIAKILATLTEQYKELLKRLDLITVTIIPTYDKRIASLERWQYLLIGAGMILGFLGNLFLKFKGIL